MTEQPLIALEGARVFINETLALGPLDFSVGRGEAVAVLGPNGAGKSALISVLQGGVWAGVQGQGTVQAGVPPASTAVESNLLEGSITRHCQQVAVVSLEEQARLIAREAAKDDSDLTDQVFEGTPARELIDETCQDDAARQGLIDPLAMTPLLDRGFRKLSTGETRKLLIIRALTCRPDLLLLDEPFEGLDVQASARVREVLHGLAPSLGMVIALNRIDELPDFVDRVLYLEGGRLAQEFFVSHNTASHNTAPHNTGRTTDSLRQVRETLSQLLHLRTTQLQMPDAEDAESPLPASNADGSLVQIKNGRVAYGDKTVFEHLNWTIMPDEHWRVIGPNGSGKTCLLNLITGDHPQCYVNDIKQFGYQRGQGESIWDIKQHLGLVSTALHWDYRLSVSVRHVILSGFHDSIGLYQRASERQQSLTDEWLHLLGMSERAHTSFARLSYGEQRLLLVARALVKHPRLLLLDEPCLGLDELNRQLVLALIQKVCEAGETTVVYVSHHAEDEVPGISNQLALGSLDQ